MKYALKNWSLISDPWGTPQVKRSQEEKQDLGHINVVILKLFNSSYNITPKEIMFMFLDRKYYQMSSFYFSFNSKIESWTQILSLVVSNRLDDFENSQKTHIKELGKKKKKNNKNIYINRIL